MRESKYFGISHPKKYSMDWMKFSLLLRLTGLMHLTLFLSHLISIHGSEPYFHDLIINIVGLHLDIVKSISFKLDMMINFAF